ncbi:magnesium transporter [Nitrosomonas cryotolerans]|uniref:Magnesium transporter MgtE n=1 Tax=Nitrosomonas cryotolerans ATCC 49181 TaxID=1131553 RepID=A0A1N6FD55_9PROT|nr:magnesium transporter [Nitrosomonas cryotolerans]SFQ00739.1 magnesium transporter [Nitrosomonas cryotolerans]SIN93185.1 magnesium transporter [Nitrosomonas cryotolerans ATCC 49181]
MTESERIPTESTKPSIDEVIILLQQADFDQLKFLLNHFHPGQLADILEAMPPKERKQLWDLIPESQGADTLTLLHDEVRNSLIVEMPTEELVAATEQMNVSDLADMIEELPERIRQSIEENLSDEIREHLETNLSFEEGTAGRLMSPDVITVRNDVTLEVVLRYLQLHEDLPDYTDGLMVIDRSGLYQGKLLLNKVLTHDKTSLVKEVMNSQHPAILATTDEHEVAHFFEQFHFVSAAVVDENNYLLGRIKMDDVICILRAKSDHALMGRDGLHEEEDLFAPVISSAKRRTVWLGINLVTAFLAAWVIGIFADTLDKIVALAVLMPIVASMGGIAGSQTLTLTIRGLALDQITNGNSGWLARKEVLIGIISGLLWALVVAGMVWLWFQDTGISLVIAAAIVINLVAAAAAGIAIPLILQRLNIDPALSGAVILTTVTDVVGFMSFLGLATYYLL